MEYLHREFDLSAGDVVEVTLAGNPANVMLLDTNNFLNFQQGRPYQYHGGYAQSSPYRLHPPTPGHWHLVVNLGGGAGRVQASGRVISGALS